MAVAPAEVGDKVRKGLKRYRGQAPVHIFTGLLKCSECGSNLVMADTRAYCCSGYINGRICSNGIRVKQKDRRSPACSRVSGEISSRTTPLVSSSVVWCEPSREPDTRHGRRRVLQAEINRYLDAVATGLMSPDDQEPH